MHELEKERSEMIRLVSYHIEKLKKVEDANEPYRHQNKCYREALNQIIKDECNMGRKGMWAEKVRIRISLLDGLHREN